MSWTTPVPDGTVERTDQGKDWGDIRGNIVAVAAGKIAAIYPNLSGFGYTIIERITGASGEEQDVYYGLETGGTPIGVRVGQRVKQGQPVARGLGTGGIEVGLWDPATGKSWGAPNFTGSNATPAGKLFVRLIHGGRSPRGGSGTSRSASLEQLWIEAGGPPNVAQTMAAIALAESGGQVGAKGGPNSDGTYDYGLWQINTVNVNSHHWSVASLLGNPEYNAKAAVAIYKSAGFGAWSTYNSGAYKQFLSQGSKASVNYGGVGGSRQRPGAGGQTGPDVTQVLTAYESQYDTPGQGVSPEFVGLFGTPIPSPGDVWGAITGAINAPLDAIKFAVWLFNPVHILRMVELVIGFILMGFGVSKVLSRSGSPLASTGQGIARVTQNVASYTPMGREARMAMGRRAGTREGQVEHARLEARRASRAREAERAS